MTGQEFVVVVCKVCHQRFDWFEEDVYAFLLCVLMILGIDKEIRESPWLTSIQSSRKLKPGLARSFCLLGSLTDLLKRFANDLCHHVPPLLQEVLVVEVPPVVRKCMEPVGLGALGLRPVHAPFQAGRIVHR